MGESGGIRGRVGKFWGESGEKGKLLGEVGKGGKVRKGGDERKRQEMDGVAWGWTLRLGDQVVLADGSKGGKARAKGVGRARCRRYL